MNYILECCCDSVDEKIEYCDYNNMPIWVDENNKYDILGVYHSETTATIVLVPLE